MKWLINTLSTAANRMFEQITSPPGTLTLITSPFVAFISPKTKPSLSQGTQHMVFASYGFAWSIRFCSSDTNKYGAGSSCSCDGGACGILNYSITGFPFLLFNKKPKKKLWQQFSLFSLKSYAQHTKKIWLLWFIGLTRDSNSSEGSLLFCVANKFPKIDLDCCPFHRIERKFECSVSCK